MAGLTPEKYQKQWESLNSLVNPKPPPEEVQRILEEKQRERKASIRVKQMFKNLNRNLIKEIERVVEEKEGKAE